LYTYNKVVNFAPAAPDGLIAAYAAVRRLPRRYGA
jgi:hypothetical protein